MSPTRSTRTPAIRTGVVAVVVFAALHVYWAAGGTLGVPTGEPITGRPVFLAYDIASAVVLVVAAGLALRLERTPTPALIRLTMVGAAVALLRGLVGVGQGSAGLMTGHPLSLGSAYDLWFTAVGALFLAVAMGDRRTVRPEVRPA